MRTVEVDETSLLITETVTRLFSDHFSTGAMRAGDDPSRFRAAWDAIEAVGLPVALLSEASGGLGLAPQEALQLLRISGGFASPVPLAETMLANWIMAEVGWAPAAGPATFAVLSAEDQCLSECNQGWRVRGAAHHIPWANEARTIVVYLPGRILRLDRAQAIVRKQDTCGVAPRASLYLDLVASANEIRAAPGLSAETIRALGAIVRTMEISGALQRIVEMTVSYACGRVQFGKPISRQQAIQQQLAILGAQAAAASAAADLAAAEFCANPDMDVVAAVKSRAGEAASVGAAIAHQVHGAIGFTREYALHCFTRSLWRWRDEYGSELFWNERLGKRSVDAGADDYWPFLTRVGERAAIEPLRQEVRFFLAGRLKGRPAILRAKSWNGFDAGFSRDLGQRGWIGMAWSRRYGGHERTYLDRYIVIEELLAAGAPVAAHWIADRQTGPLLIKYGTEEQKSSILPRIAAGEVTACIGMSESDCGSDLAAVRTRADPVEGGFRINGTKLWTTFAHRAQYMVLLCRTSGTTSDRHVGLSQLLVPLATAGITIRPVIDLAGEHHFNEVIFENVFLPRSAALGELGNGWEQVMSELAFERSGPERFLSSMVLLVELIRILGRNPAPQVLAAIGRLSAHLVVLRHMSREIAKLLEKGTNPTLQASIVKDLGTGLEQEVPEVVRSLVEVDSTNDTSREFGELLSYMATTAPSFSVRGGTREILRGIIARGLGLR